MGLYPEGTKIEEYVPKIHFMTASGVVACDTANPREGTENESEVTCKRCLKRLENITEILERGNVPLLYNVSVESPPIRQNGKKLLQAWLNMIPDDIKLSFNTNYSTGTTLTATWAETRDNGKSDKETRNNEDQSD
jgi:hypothetical protein